MWKDWLSFSRAERYGIILLFSLVCLAAIYPFIHRTFLFNPVSLTNPKVYSQIDSFFLSLQHNPPEYIRPFSMVDEELPPAENPQLFNFDPNTVTTSQLVLLGFSKRQAAVIENYRNRGGEFHSPSDFAKMYVVDSSIFARLKPYISIEPLGEKEEFAQHSASAKIGRAHV